MKIFYAYIIGYIAFLFFLAFFVPSKANAYADRYLIFAIDVSASIDYNEYKLQREAYIQVLRDEDIRDSLDGTYIAIMEFGGRAELLYSFTNDYDALADAYELHVKRAAVGGWTQPTAAVQLALALFKNVDGIKTFDISGDGVSSASVNKGGYKSYKSRPIPNPNFVTSMWKQKLTDAGITSNALVIADDYDYIRRWYKRTIINGFIIDSVEINDFYKALRKKLRMEIM